MRTKQKPVVRPETAVKVNIGIARPAYDSISRMAKDEKRTISNMTRVLILEAISHRG